ncbi:hypothetical protein [Nonomuraea typhae]|uniref:Uncharacterized protein n=1 Tax=Nonomuraea typhae TaxID=2603600 RepID=A0ABW7Z5N9_9ACTN
MDSIISDIIRVLHQWPDEPETGKDLTFFERLHQASQGRTRLEQELIEAKEAHEGAPPFDPLLYKLTQLVRAREQIDEQIRDLFVYARHFVRPRPYPLAVLAKASGMSASGIRLSSGTEGRMREIARNIGRSDNSGCITPPKNRAMEELADALAEYRNVRTGGGREPKAMGRNPARKASGPPPRLREGF